MQNMTFCVSKIEPGGIFSYIKVEKNDFPTGDIWNRFNSLITEETLSYI